MTENKRYYRTNVNLEDNNHEPYYNIRDRKKEGNNVLFMVGGKYTSKEIVDRLNGQEERIKDLETRNNRQYERLKELTDLMFKRDWETLNNMVDEWEKEEEQQQKYGG